MVGMATRASKNHISWSGIESKGKHKKSGVKAFRIFAMHGVRICTGAAGKIFDH